MTNDAKTLVERLEAEKGRADFPMSPMGAARLRGYNDGLDEAIAIDREMSARVPEDAARIAVARALCKWRNGKRSSVAFSELSMPEQHAYFEQADDAIAAMQSMGDDHNRKAGKLPCSGALLTSPAQTSELSVIGESDIKDAIDNALVMAMHQDGSLVEAAFDAVSPYLRQAGPVSWCPSCGGNDANHPCAYPGDNKRGCMRDERLGAHKPVMSEVRTMAWYILGRTPDKNTQIPYEIEKTEDSVWEIASKYAE